MHVCMYVYCYAITRFRITCVLLRVYRCIQCNARTIVTCQIKATYLITYLLTETTTQMPSRQHHHPRDVINTSSSSSCSRCAALMTQCAALQRRVELQQRQLRASANLHALLAAKDRELAACRARLQQRGRLATTTMNTRCTSKAGEDDNVTTLVQEHQQSKLAEKSEYK